MKPGSCSSKQSVQEASRTRGGVRRVRVLRSDVTTRRRLRGSKHIDNWQRCWVINWDDELARSKYSCCVIPSFFVCSSDSHSDVRGVHQTLGTKPPMYPGVSKILANNYTNDAKCEQSLCLYPVFSVIHSLALYWDTGYCELVGRTYGCIFHWHCSSTLKSE